MNRGSNYVRLTKKFQQLRDKGDPKVLKLLSDDQPKYSKSFMVAGGLSAYGVGKLIFCAGNQDQKAYMKTLDYFNEDIIFLQQKYEGAKLLLQQDNASCHVGGLSQEKIKKIFFTINNIPEPQWPGNIPKKANYPGHSAKAFRSLVEETEKRQAAFRVQVQDRNGAWEEANKNQYRIELDWPPNSPVIIINLIRT